MLSRHATRLLAGSPAGRCQHFAVCALVALAAATTARAAPTRCGADTPLGSHAMVYLDAPYSFKEAMFRESARLGASEIRVDLALTAVFPAPGTEDWRQVDEVMALARRFRLRPLGVLLATPAFIAACPPGAPSYTCPPADLDAWKQMVATLVAHTRGVIDTFEILNEPDGHWAFTGTPADYAALLRAGHDAITAANPHAKIAIAATMSLGSQPWLNHVLADAGPHAEQLYDIANIHLRAPLRRLRATVRAWRIFFANHNARDKPLWITEFGYPSDPAYQYDQAYRSGPGSQAAYLQRALPTLLDAHATKVFVTLRDNLGGQFASEGVIGGTVKDPPQPDPIVEPKPAVAALRHLAATRSLVTRPRRTSPAGAGQPRSRSRPQRAHSAPLTRRLRWTTPVRPRRGPDHARSRLAKRKRPRARV